MHTLRSCASTISIADKGCGSKLVAIIVILTKEEHLPCDNQRPLMLKALHLGKMETSQYKEIKQRVDRPAHLAAAVARMHARY